ncbi:site-specific integrase [Comamonas fluminis]|uniref:site-specific integrase n=1 Tax=Comamonas fluminis TaxID=2796366 RepID=UPI001C493872|nr:site-specific integrase [Comamonas fluminis]
MASITKRSYVSWQVAAKDSTLKIKRTFLSKSEALDFAKQLEGDGIAVAKLAKTETLAWQVRVRKKGFPELVESFATKTEAQAWSVAREAEMHQRKFVDYREAERHSLGDLMRKYANKVLKDKRSDHPDLVRIHKICRHPITQIAMHMLQPSDVAAYRDQRLEGGFVEPADTRKLSLALRTWSPIKGASVKKEMELISRIISIAMREWNIHLPFNPASGKHCTRPEAQEGDERNRRLEDRAPEILDCSAKGNVERNRRKYADLEYVLDSEIETLLKAAGGEQINLLRACRYPEWFRPQKKEVTAASLRSRKLKKVKPKVKARLRQGLRLWAIVSFAIETGMRRGEMLALQWQHLHHTPDGAYLLLPAAITKTKTERVVPLTLRAERILKTQPNVAELIFNSNYEALKTAYRRAKEKVQIQDLRLHDLRHEATSRLNRPGFPRHF